MLFEGAGKDVAVGADKVAVVLCALVATDDAVVEDGVELLGAGEAVLWLDTESGLADSSITISPGDPGESGGMSDALLDVGGAALMQAFLVGGSS